MSDHRAGRAATCHRRRNHRCPVPIPARPDGPPGAGDLTIGHRAVRPAVGLATVAAAAAIGWVHRSSPAAAIVLVAIVACYGALCAVDLAEQRLPDRITLPLAAATAAGSVTVGLSGGEPKRAAAALAAGVGFSLVLYLFRFGLGDVKLAVTVGIVAGWLGPDAIRTTTVAGSLCGAVVAVAVLATNRRRDATFGFGPCLVVGSIAGMLVAA